MTTHVPFPSKVDYTAMQLAPDKIMCGLCNIIQKLCNVLSLGEY